MTSAALNNFTLKFCVEETECILSLFYDTLIKQLFSAENFTFVTAVRQSLNSIRQVNSFEKKGDKAQNATNASEANVCFENTAARCAYMCGYSILHSSIVLHHFLKFLENNSNIIEKISKMKCLRVCCLGGGPAPEAVAICKVVSDLMTKFASPKRPPLDVFITVVDECEHWGSIASSVINSLQNCQDLCDTGRIKLHFEFIQADLKNALSNKVQAALKEAHFVTMVKFVSAVYNNQKGNFVKTSKMIDTIVSHMKFGACLFYLDNAGGGFYQKFEKTFEEFYVLSHVYGPCYHNEYRLHGDTVKKVTQMYRETFGQEINCSSRTTVSCEVFYKIKENMEKELELAGRGRKSDTGMGAKKSENGRASDKRMKKRLNKD